MQNYIGRNNYGLIIGRQGQVVGDMPWNMIFISSKPSDMNIFYRGGGINFPLYLYPENDKQHAFDSNPNDRIPNLSPSILKQIESVLSLNFTAERETNETTFSPIDVLDYIYAVLHSPAYRETYKEFLKIDFPRVPYPTDKDEFWRLVKIGGELRLVHLLEAEVTEKCITQYPVDGDNVVGKIQASLQPSPEERELLRVYINGTQYFEGVPKAAWEFYIGGYQPAQKWLKDRKGRALGFEDILHYQKIIVALTETGRLMEEVDKHVSIYE